MHETDMALIACLRAALCCVCEFEFMHMYMLTSLVYVSSVYVVTGTHAHVSHTR